MVTLCSPAGDEALEVLVSVEDCISEAAVELQLPPWIWLAACPCLKEEAWRQGSQVLLVATPCYTVDAG